MTDNKLARQIAEAMACTPDDDDDLVEAVRLLVAERDAAVARAKQAEESVAEPLRLYRAAYDRLEAVNLRLAAVRELLGDWDYAGMAEDCPAAGYFDPLIKAHRAWLVAGGKEQPRDRPPLVEWSQRHGRQCGFKLDNCKNPDEHRAGWKEQP